MTFIERCERLKEIGGKYFKCAKTQNRSFDEFLKTALLTIAGTVSELGLGFVKLSPPLKQKSYRDPIPVFCEGRGGEGGKN